MDPLMVNVMKIKLYLIHLNGVSAQKKTKKKHVKFHIDRYINHFNVFIKIRLS